MAAGRGLVGLSVTPPTLVWILVLLVSYYCGAVSSQLTADFYATSCPNVSGIVQAVVAQAVQSETRVAASMLRMHFHDCFVQGCDGSVLLIGSSSEKLDSSNVHSLRRFDVVDSIKRALESVCYATVSCADILALAAQASVSLVGGPSWTVLLGRRDGTKPASNATVVASLPGPFNTLDVLKTKFRNVGLNSTDMAVLSGAHTIGFGHCSHVVRRLYNYNGTGQPDPIIPTSYRKRLEKRCPNGGDPHSVVPIDLVTPSRFDNQYYINVEAGKGLFQSDEELYARGESTASLITSFARNQKEFFEHFGASMVKMGNISPLTGKNGEIRLNCRKPNRRD